MKEDAEVEAEGKAEMEAETETEQAWVENIMWHGIGNETVHFGHTCISRFLQRGLMSECDTQPGKLY